MKFHPKALKTFCYAITVSAFLMSSTSSDNRPKMGLERRLSSAGRAASDTNLTNVIARPHIRYKTTNNKSMPTHIDLHRRIELNLEWEPLGNIIGRFDARSLDRTGSSIAMSNDGRIIAVGSDGDRDYAGKVTVYRLEDDKQWKPYGKELKGTDSNGMFGHSLDVSSDGKRLVVGGSSGGNKAKVFEMTTDWNQVGDDLVGDDLGDAFGWRVMMAGDGLTIAVAAIWDNVNGENSGSVQIFVDDSGLGPWKNVKKFVGEGAKDFLGLDIALSKDASILAIGANAYVNYIEFGKKSDGSIDWNQANIMKLDGYGAFFGGRVSLSGDGKYLAVSGYNGAMVKVFVKSDENVLEQFEQEFSASSSAPTSLSNDGRILVVGIPDQSGGGQVRIFKLIDDKGEEPKDDSCTYDTCKYVGDYKYNGDHLNLLDDMGFSVATSGDGLTVAAGSTHSSYVRVFGFLPQVCMYNSTVNSSFISKYCIHHLSLFILPITTYML